MIRPRFLSSSLAAVAVAATVTLAGPSAQAADPRCGRPATTVVHPAQTHTEWLWERTEVVRDAWTAQQYTRTLREYGHTAYQWTRYVIDQQHVPGTVAVPPTYETLTRWTRTTPAVTESTDWVRQVPADDPATGAWTQIDERTVEDQPAVITYVPDPDSSAPYAYIDKHGALKYRDSADWNGGADRDHDEGWNREPALDRLVPVVTAPAMTHQEFRYTRVVTPQQYDERLAVSSPGDGWVDTGETTRGDLITPGTDAVAEIPEEGHRESGQTSEPTPPAGEGWLLVGSTVHTLQAYTAPDTSGTPWVATGNTEPPEVVLVGGPVGGPVGAPEGEGWVKGATQLVPAVTRRVVSTTTLSQAPDERHPWSMVRGSGVEVTDTPAWTETIPGTADCHTPGTKDESDPDDATAPSPQLGGDVAPAPQEEGDVSLVGQHPDQVAAPQAAPAVTTGVLPNTGSGASLPLAAAGLGSLVAGAALVLRARRQRFDVN